MSGTGTRREKSEHSIVTGNRNARNHHEQRLAGPKSQLDNGFSRQITAFTYQPIALDPSR
jgi:hypothetical protein